MALTKFKIGDFIAQRREKYDGKDILPIFGVSREGFIPPKQEDADTSIYNVFYKNDFVFNPARMELNSIALNINFDKAICSSLYEIFYIIRTDIVIPEYLNLFIKRDEFARKCWFDAVGSARNYFRVSNLSEFEIELPPLPIQQKYVDIYKAMVENQQTYERGLDDLKLVCDAYIEDLRRKIPCEEIGPYIQEIDNKNTDLELGLENVRGISIDKKFIPTKANMDGVSLNNYKIVEPKMLAFISDTSRRGDKISLAHNQTERSFIVSSISTVIKTDKTKLLSDYLYLFFIRNEFDRYARFNSWGSARETFDWEEMCDVKIPIPDTKIQQSIVNIYNAYNKRKEINEKLKAQIKEICPILIKGSVEEAKRGCKNVSAAV